MAEIKYKNIKTGEIIEWDGMLFLSMPPQLKIIENGEIKMMRLSDFEKEYQKINES